MNLLTRAFNAFNFTGKQQTTPIADTKANTNHNNEPVAWEKVNFEGTAWHLIKFTVTTLRCFTSSNTIIGTSTIEFDPDKLADGKEDATIMCDGCNQIHDPAKMFGNGKHICLSCPMIPLTSYYEVAQNRVRCINALSNLAPGDLKEDNLTSIHEFVERCGQHPELTYCTGAGHVYSDKDTRMDITGPSDTAKLFTRIGPWVCAVGDGTVNLYNTTTAAEYKLPVWWNTRPTAALVAGKTLYIAADKLVKKLDIARFWEVAYKDIDEITTEKEGSGNYGDIYYGKYKNTLVARKEFKRVVLTHEDSLTRELEFLSIIGYHENVIGIVGITKKGQNAQSILMKRGGQTLKSLLEKKGWLIKREILIIMTGIAKGLHHIHSHNILHCDLKPENILVDDKYIPQICDFGLSRYVDEECVYSYGTPNYMPDDYRCLSVDHWKRTFKRGEKYIDIYSFGQILEEIVTQYSNFTRTTDINMLVDIANQCKDIFSHVTAGSVIGLLEQPELQEDDD